MAVRLRNVTSHEEGPLAATARCEDALKPSTRIMGGRIADKLGNRMGLRLSGDRFLPDQSYLTLLEEPLGRRRTAFGQPVAPAERV